MLTKIRHCKPPSNLMNAKHMSSLESRTPQSKYLKFKGRLRAGWKKIKFTRSGVAHKTLGSGRYLSGSGASQTGLVGLISLGLAAAPARGGGGTSKRRWWPQDSNTWKESQETATNTAPTFPIFSSKAQLKTRWEMTIHTRASTPEP